jgi:serine kinase of HPr protein (carbohydrate metabolism regulator)
VTDEHLYQATSVSVAGRAILIEGASGTGKSSLALALIDRGATLVGDDGTALSVRDGQLWAAPPRHTAGLMEVRNLGIVPMPCTEAPAALILRLDPTAPRFIEQAETIEFLGVRLPLIVLWPDSPVLTLRAEMALRQYGLPGSGTGT